MILTQSHRRCKMRNLNTNTVFKPKSNTINKGRKKSVFSISGLASYITKISMCVCVFWPPGELEKAGGKAAIGRWQRCYQPDDRLPRPSFDQQVTEKGCGLFCKQTLSSKLNFSQKLNFPSPSTDGKDNPQEAPSQFARHGTDEN